MAPYQYYDEDGGGCCTTYAMHEKLSMLRIAETTMVGHCESVRRIMEIGRGMHTCGYPEKQKHSCTQKVIRYEAWDEMEVARFGNVTWLGAAQQLWGEYERSVVVGKGGAAGGGARCRERSAWALSLRGSAGAGAIEKLQKPTPHWFWPIRAAAICLISMQARHRYLPKAFLRLAAYTQHKKYPFAPTATVSRLLPLSPTNLLGSHSLLGPSFDLVHQLPAED
ncbi:hypothetical protein WOLCODRAFT_145364, partial [Wolfiporia cocos MD-104 SS10]